MQYCVQCMEEFQLRDLSPLRNKCSEGEAASAKCDGCGPTLVDKTGTCIGECEDKHGQYPVDLPNGNYLVFPNGRIIKDNRIKILTGDSSD